jgi:hypothetical protein
MQEVVKLVLDQGYIRREADKWHAMLRMPHKRYENPVA